MPLQRVQNAAARLILDLRMNQHVTPTLRQLHWLPVDRRVDFKLSPIWLVVLNTNTTIDLVRHLQIERRRTTMLGTLKNDKNGKVCE